MAGKRCGWYSYPAATIVVNLRTQCQLPVMGSFAPAVLLCLAASALPASAQIYVGASSNGTPSLLSVALAGDATGVASPGISSDRSALNFGSIPVAAQSAAQQVWLTNTGSTNLDVTAVTVGAPFTLASGATCAATMFSLTPGQSCMLQVQFAPTVSGAHAGTLSFASNAGSLAIALTGEGVATAAVNQNVTSAATPVNAGGGGSAGPGGVLLLLAIGALARRRRFS